MIIAEKKERILPEQGPFRWKFWGAESDIEHGKSQIEFLTMIKRKMRRDLEKNWRESVALCEQLIDGYEAEIVQAETELKNIIAQHFDWLRRREVQNVQ